MNEIIRRISNDKLIIFICFALAVFLWISSQLSKTINHRVELALNFKSTSTMAIASELPKFLEFDAHGTGWSLLFSNLSQHAIWNHQLSNQREIILTETDISKKIIQDFELENIELSNLFPSHLFIKQDSLINKNVPIKSTLKIYPNDGFVKKTKGRVTPKEINLIGPAEMLAKINYWSIGEIQLKQHNGKFEAQKSIILNSGNDFLQIDQKEVTVFVEFEELTEKSFTIPIELDTTGTQIERIFPKDIIVKVKVGLSKFNAIKASDFELIIELDSINKSNTHIVRINKSPEEVTIIDLTPSYVDIYFRDN